MEAASTGSSLVVMVVAAPVVGQRGRSSCPLLSLRDKPVQPPAPLLGLHRQNPQREAKEGQRTLLKPPFLLPHSWVTPDPISSLIAMGQELNLTTTASTAPYHLILQTLLLSLSAPPPTVLSPNDIRSCTGCSRTAVPMMPLPAVRKD